MEGEGKEIPGSLRPGPPHPPRLTASCRATVMSASFALHLMLSRITSVVAGLVLPLAPGT